MKHRAAEALIEALAGKPGAKPFVCDGRDMYGRWVSEVCDPSKSLADLIEERTGRRPAISVAVIRRDG